MVYVPRVVDAELSELLSVILAVRVGGISRAEGVAALTALRDAQHITAELAEAWLDPTYAPDAEIVEVTSSYEQDEALEQD